MIVPLPPSREVYGEGRRRCGCMPCLIELCLHDLAAAVEISRMSEPDRERVAKALLDTFDRVIPPL